MKEAPLEWSIPTEFLWFLDGMCLQIEVTGGVVVADALHDLF